MINKNRAKLITLLALTGMIGTTYPLTLWQRITSGLFLAGLGASAASLLYDKAKHKASLPKKIRTLEMTIVKDAFDAALKSERKGFNRVYFGVSSPIILQAQWHDYKRELYGPSWNRNIQSAKNNNIDKKYRIRANYEEQQPL